MTRVFFDLQNHTQPAHVFRAMNCKYTVGSSKCTYIRLDSIRTLYTYIYASQVHYVSGHVTYVK